VPVHRRGDRVRCQQVLDHSESAAPVLGVDEKAVSTTVNRPEYFTLAGD
jgi:hypothetical protein